MADLTDSPPAADCLAPSPSVDSDHPAIQSLARGLTVHRESDIDKAVTLYYWARDNIRYDPYAVSLSPAGYRASETLAAGRGWCVTKAALLAALCRAVGVPARLGFADVRNHLSTERLRETMQTDVFYFHGYTAIYLQGKWVKATPAFNLELCERFGLQPLEFDGMEDSIYHPFDCAGNQHMEYLNDRGQFVDIPFEDMMATFNRHYPRMMALLSGKAAPPAEGDWDAEVASETTGR